MVAPDWAWLSVVLVAGCSTTNNIVNSTCGPGTALVDGVCVPAVDASADSSSADSVPVTDSEVGAADTTEAGDADAAMDTGGETTTWSFEPCATFKAIDPDAGRWPSTDNCSKDVCPGFGKTCRLTCEAMPSATKAIWLWAPNDESYIRLPEAKDAPICSSPCADKNGVRGFHLSLYQPKSHIHMRVEPPWQIQDVALDTCPIPLKGTQCLDTVGRDEYHRVFVFTLDPTAPARNLFIKHVNTDPLKLCP